MLSLLKRDIKSKAFRFAAQRNATKFSFLPSSSVWWINNFPFRKMKNLAASVCYARFCLTFSVNKSTRGPRQCVGHLSCLSFLHFHCCVPFPLFFLSLFLIAIACSASHSFLPNDICLRPVFVHSIHLPSLHVPNEMKIKNLSLRKLRCLFGCGWPFFVSRVNFIKKVLTRFLHM